jgi:hypothetical protein
MSTGYTTTLLAGGRPQPGGSALWRTPQRHTSSPPDTNPEPQPETCAGTHVEGEATLQCYGGRDVPGGGRECPRHSGTARSARVRRSGHAQPPPRRVRPPGERLGVQVRECRRGRGPPQEMPRRRCSPFSHPARSPRPTRHTRRGPRPMRPPPAAGPRGTPRRGGHPRQERLTRPRRSEFPAPGTGRAGWPPLPARSLQ